MYHVVPADSEHQRLSEESLPLQTTETAAAAGVVASVLAASDLEPTAVRAEAGHLLFKIIFNVVSGRVVEARIEVGGEQRLFGVVAENIRGRTFYSEILVQRHSRMFELKINITR